MFKDQHSMTKISQKRVKEIERSKISKLRIMHIVLYIQLFYARLQSSFMVIVSFRENINIASNEFKWETHLPLFLKQESSISRLRDIACNVNYIFPKSPSMGFYVQWNHLFSSDKNCIFDMGSYILAVLNLNVILDSPINWRHKSHF